MSILEVLSALLISSVLLVPSSVLITDSIRWTNRIEGNTEVRRLSTSIHAETSWDLADEFANGNFGSSDRSGDCSHLGRSNYRFESSWSPLASSGLGSETMLLRVLCWQDVDGNRLLDSSEPNLTTYSMIARR